MKITGSAAAGTMESSDVLIRVEPKAGTLEVEVESVVKQQYGEAIEAAVRAVLGEQQVEEGRVMIQDHGALDCVIRARMETALKRGGLA